MTPLLWALLFIVSSCDSLSIGAAKQNVTKRETSKNVYPDWVPFKNDKGELLAEFVDVAKSKPKKRLAHPKNFVMKAVAEPQADDYDKEQGESDNEDYYEKKDWSDVHRPAQAVDLNKPINHTNVADIDGIVNIIIKPKDDPILRALKARRKKAKEIAKEAPKDKIKRQNEEDTTNENISKEVKIQELKTENKEENSEKKEKKTTKTEDDADYEEGSTEKPKTDAEKAKEEELKENEAKKKKLLDSVDELKQRHAVEQRTISEKSKEEEIYKETLERDRIRPQENSDKYAQDGSRWKKLYDEYEDQEPVVVHKYQIKPLKTSSTTTTTKRPPKRADKQKQKKSNKTIASGKLSVFRNPQLYIVNDKEDAPTTAATSITPTAAINHTLQKFSSQYSDSSTPDNLRISLVPEDRDVNAGESTPFFPNIAKSTRTFNENTTTTAPDSAADSSEEKERSTVVTASDASTSTTLTRGDTDSSEITAASATDADSSASNNAPKASQSAPRTADTAISAQLVRDSAQASTHNKEEKKDQDFHLETGNGKHHHSEHDEIHDEHGKKAYEGVHKDTRSNKGHHDKENHLDKYHDHGGVDKSHHDEDNHYGSHHHEEHGKKHAKYEESGKHSKGHSTKGSHDIHKKEEYEKKVEFFEEEGDSDDEEFDGGHHSKKDHSSGKHFKKGNLHSSYGGHSKGEKGDFAKGGHGHHTKGHKASSGHDSHGHHGNHHHENGGKRGGKKWVYHHGHPAKTAHLVIVDRRNDGYMHAPTYYG